MTTFLVPTTRIARETYPASTGATGYTPAFSAESHLSPRMKRRLFRRTLLYAAKTALAASTISAAQYNTILALYQRPWRKTTATGAVVDVLDLVRDDLNDLAYSTYGAYVTDWWGQILTGTTPARTWLASSAAMLGSNGLGTAEGVIYSIGVRTPA